MTRHGQLNLDPKTSGRRAADLRIGDVVLESDQHPARIVRLSYTTSRVNIYCRFIWQTKREREWKLGAYRPTDRIETAKEGEY